MSHGFRAEQPAHETEFQAFFRKMKELSREGHGTSRDSDIKEFFVPEKALADYMDETRLLALLKSLFKTSMMPYIRRIRNGYTKVFAILLSIHKGHFISVFIRHDGLCDRFLPFFQKPDRFPHDEDADFFENFQKKQWYFCPWNFGETDMEISIDHNYVLPIQSRTRVGREGFAHIYRIEIDAAYDNLKRVGQDREEIPRTCRKPNNYALKVYRSRDAKRSYEAEVKALQLLKNHTHGYSIVEVFGSFEYRDTFSIVLEFADRGNLDNYFHRASPPTSPEDILAVWTSFLRLIHAVWEMHNIPSREGPEDDPIGWTGFHQDIIPKNILVFSGPTHSDYDVEFKLADLGLCHFRQHNQTDQEQTDRDVGGTREYGPPEAYRGPLMDRLDRDISPKFDIWSLGCVLSEFAVYVVHNWDGVIAYRDERKSETSKINNHKDIGCFHDTRSVLKSVSRRHSRLLPNEVRKLDFVTVPIIEKMIRPMLTPLNLRQDATHFLRVSQDLLAESRKVVDQFMMGQENDLLESEEAEVAVPPGTSTTISFMGLDRRLSYRDAPRYSLPNQQLDEPSLHEGPETGFRQSPPTTPDFDHGVRPDSVELSPTNATSQNTSPGPWTPQNTFGSSNHFRYGSDDSVKAKRAFSSPPGHVFPENNPSSPQFVRTRYLENTQHLPPSQPKPDLTPSRHVVNRPQSIRIEREPPRQNKAGDKKDDLPYVTFEEAKNRRATKRKLGCEEIVEELGKRDVIFLLDDAESMNPHWSLLIEVVRLMAHELKPLDTNGMELKFMISDDILTAKTATGLTSVLESHRRKGKSNINERLGSILQGYEADLASFSKRMREYREASGHKRVLLKRKPTQVKPLNIYIFTDGKWEKDNDATDIIRSAADCLRKYNRSRHQLGIEIVRFGDDPDAKLRLQALDDLGKQQSGPLDIVDTTYVKDNFIKMLVGASRADYDAEGNGSDPEHE